MLLPTLHQSSLGTLMLLAGSRLHPLWRTPILPLLFLISSVAMGYAAVVFEATLSSVAFNRRPETAMLARLARAIVPLQIVFVVLRMADLVWQGNGAALLAGDVRSAMVWIESAMFLAPVVMLMRPAARYDLGRLFGAAVVMMFAGALYRFDTYLVAFNPGAQWAYFPSVPEITITVGLVAFEVLVYIVVVKTFPVLAGRPALEKAV
jgi:Ni/Fe-hydrogenase subunit HybB-like protein